MVSIPDQLPSIYQTPADSKEDEVTVSFIGDLPNIYVGKFITTPIGEDSWYINLALGIPCRSQDTLACDFTRTLIRPP